MRIPNKILAILAVVLGTLAFASSATADLAYTFTSGTGVAVTGSNYTAGGVLNLSLGFAPTPGTNLTVVKNAGLSFINGTFDGVPQGGTVPLTYNGVTYNYIANYYGGNGRSLVLQWPYNGLAAWGYNDHGELGNNSTTCSLVPVAVTANGTPMAGKTVVAIAGGVWFSLALTLDGNVFAWGLNNSGELGNNSTIGSLVPVAVTTSGTPMAGKTVVAIAAGSDHSLALTSDGLVFAWGDNFGGKLGNNSKNRTDSLVPVAVTTSGTPMAGKTVVAIASGINHSLALTSDGQVFAWGANTYGQLGNNSTTDSLVPVAVTTSGTPLAGKAVVAIAGGGYQSLALTSDGQIFAWGDNTYGQLGNNSTTGSMVPVAVTTSGTPLAGKTVVAIAGGDSHSLALTSDGKVFAWGFNNIGQLGNNGQPAFDSHSVVPVAVTTSGTPLAGRTVTAIVGGQMQSLALTSDGSIFSWGSNGLGELGNNSTIASSVPVAVDTKGTLASKTVIAIAGNGGHNLALFGTGKPPSITANPVNQTGASGATVTFTAVAASDNPAPTVQWQVSATGTVGPFSNIDTVANPTAATGTLTLTNVALAQNGYAYRAIFTNSGASTTTTAAILNVNVLNLLATFNSGADVPVTMGGSISVSGSLRIVLGFAPTPGTNLTVVNNTGPAFISGQFSNVPQGGTVSISFKGTTYNYIANYYGGNGRSLVLQWPCVGVVAWGFNNYGELGNNGSASRLEPVAVDTSGALLGKTVVAISSGGGCGSHTLALSSDGQIFAWGANNSGELGNNSTAYSSAVPVAVYGAGFLSGKTVVAVAAGDNHSLALTSDGQVFAWGGASQLGNNSTTNSSVPLPINTAGPLADRTVVAIAAGGYHSLALTSDGQVFAWGQNGSGQLGNNSTADSLVPVAISSGALAGKTVVAIDAGEYHSVALTSDGQVFTWGQNWNSQLGNNSTTGSLVPVAVDVSGVLAGKKIVALAAKGYHNLALSADGQVFAWGDNSLGQLGNNSTTSSLVPVAVDTTGALGGKVVMAVVAGYDHGLALTADGQVLSWGYGSYGQLGNRSTANSPVPVVVSTSGALSGKRVMAIAAGVFHSLALLGSGAPSAANSPVNQTVTSGATAIFSAVSTDSPAPTVQWQVSTTGTAGIFKNIVGNPTATTRALVLGDVTAAQAGWAYRAVFTNSVGNCNTSAATLSVVNGKNLGITFNSANDTALKCDSVVVSGSLNVKLGFDPTPGTNLTVVRNDGPAFISRTFSNIAQGGTVSLAFNGKTYNYIANYYGENGRSLVLQWPCIGVSAWGYNQYGNLGNNTGTRSLVPVSVVTNGALSGKTMVAVAAGCYHSVGLATNGQIFAWGNNSVGQLGNNTTTGSLVPVVVDTQAFAGRTIIAIAAGNSHNLALTSDGQVFSWGYNQYGQLGNNSTMKNLAPVAVSSTSALAGKTVVAIAAGISHSLALTSDGQIFAWGNNASGQLGNNSLTNSLVPVQVSMGGALGGKIVVAIAAGNSHSLAITSDGQVFAWGNNTNGELGNGSTTNSPTPVAVNTGGVLAGKTVVSIAGGQGHSLALTSDGRVFAWGANFYGELGNNSTTKSSVPMPTDTTGTLSGKTVTTIAAGALHSLASTSDGQAFAWGRNYFGQVGNNSTIDSPVPVEISNGGILAGKAITALVGGNDYSLALFASGAPSVTMDPAAKTGTCGSTISFSAAATDNPAPTVQWQVSTTGTVGPFSNIDCVTNPTAATGSLTLSNVTLEQNGYAYQAVFTNNAGSCTSAAATLTVQRTLAAFQGQYGLLNPDPTSDPYQTGVCQLLAYAFGVNPSAPDRSQMPAMEVQNGYLQISYPRWKDAADVTYVVEVSADLQNWYSGIGNTMEVSVTPIDSTREQVIVRDLIPYSTASRRFIRVKITH